jgi:predicted TIM-barrel fold metal-dependent hydrolase
LGGLGLWDETLEHLAGKDIYMDTSCCHDAIPAPAMGALLARHDRGRILFGSDYPLFSPKAERLALARLLAKLRVSDCVILDNGTRLAQNLQPVGFAGRPPAPGIDFS